MIAEHKRRSPVGGRPAARAPTVDRDRRAPTSAAARRRCRSSPSAQHFGGSLEDLREARAATDLPILRKDFIVDPYQLYESAAAGADAVLLIVAALDPRRRSRALHAEARALDLDVLVEVHDEEELDAALEIDAEVIGINNRDLDDFTVDIERTFELLADVPAGKTVVSESGFSDREQIDELERVGRGRRAGRRDADARARPRGRLPRARRCRARARA